MLFRSAKKLGRPWDVAKGFDCSAPCGPLIPKHEIEIGLDDLLQLRVDNELLQECRIHQMIWSVPETISILSHYFRLMPGDLIMTGTPAGVGTLTSIQYGTAGFPSVTSPGPINRGNNFFSGGTSIVTNPFQFFDVSAIAGAIDAGTVRYDLSGFFGGKTDSDDFAGISMVLFSQRGAEAGRTSIGFYTKEDRANITGLLEASSSAVVPIGTRRISVELRMIGVGLYNDASADNLSLVLTDINAAATSVPEPSAIPGVLIGGALVVGAIKKRRQKL